VTPAIGSTGAAGRDHGRITSSRSIWSSASSSVGLHCPVTQPRPRTSSCSCCAMRLSCRGERTPQPRLDRADQRCSLG